MPLCLVCLASVSLCVDHDQNDTNHSDDDHENQADHEHDDHDHDDHLDQKNDLQSRFDQPNNQKLVGAVLVISLCGVFGVLVIPIMQRVFYQHLIQFLIALAVGTLAGDALVHLLPHAFQAGVGHSGGSAGKHSEHVHHQTTVWQGFVAILALIFFFLFEKLINILGEWRDEKASAKRRATPTNKKLRVVREGHAVSDKAVREHLCKHKYSPYCMDDFDLEEVNTNMEKLEGQNECVAKGCETGNDEKTTPESEMDPSSS